MEGQLNLNVLSANSTAKVQRLDFEIRYEQPLTNRTDRCLLYPTFKQVLGHCCNSAISKASYSKNLWLFRCESKGELKTKYFFDEESYQRFRDSVVSFCGPISVAIQQLELGPKDKSPLKVLVVTSSINQQVHEVPVISDWEMVRSMILSGIPRHFFPFEFFHMGPNGLFSFFDAESWAFFFKFVTHSMNKGQRYFQISAGRGSAKEQIVVCRREYANSVMPLMQKHKAVLQNPNLSEANKLEDKMRLTREMAGLRTRAGTYLEVEAGIRESMLASAIQVNKQWMKLYDLPQQMISSAKKSEQDGAVTYLTPAAIDQHSTDFSEMLLVLNNEILRVDIDL